MEEQSVYHLSDAYEKKTGDIALDLIVQVININTGFNEELKTKSPTLCQYMQFVDCVRNYQKSYPLEEALEYAIDDCIRNQILTDFLRKNRAEVLHTVLFAYDQEEHIRMEKEESLEEGIEKGMEKGKQEMIFSMLQDGMISLENALKKSKLQKKEFLEKMSQAGFHLPGEI